MKIRTIIIFLIVLFTFTITIYASEINTGFTLESTFSESQEYYEDITVLTLEPQKRSIYCFAVNEKNGLIAIGQYIYPYDAIVSVYNSYGVFEYGYSFTVGHSEYGLEWDGDNIVVYFPKNEVVASYAPDGTLQGIGKVEFSNENGLYGEHLAHRLEIEVNGCKYVRKNNAKTFYLASSRSCLVKINESGAETLIYDSSTYGAVYALIVFILCSIFISILIFVFIDLRKRKKATLS